MIHANTLQEQASLHGDGGSKFNTTGQVPNGAIETIAQLIRKNRGAVLAKGKLFVHDVNTL
jgi:hypothetical protein